MSSQMSTSEPGMITIEKNYFSIKKIWPKKTFNSIPLALTYGYISLLPVILDFRTTREGSMQSIEMSSKK